MENEFKKILGEVKDVERFDRFMKFCVERLNRGDDVSEIWTAWNLENN